MEKNEKSVSQLGKEFDSRLVREESPERLIEIFQGVTGMQSLEQLRKSKSVEQISTDLQHRRTGCNNSWFMQ